MNDLENHPHAFVIACLVDVTIKTTRAWHVPLELKKRLGYFDMPQLFRTSVEDIVAAMSKQPKLHAMSRQMGVFVHEGIRRIHYRYVDDASRIWSDTPTIRELRERLMAFKGIGPTNSAMASNTLVRGFDIPVKDRRSVDVSTDRYVHRVASRLGLIAVDASLDAAKLFFRRMNPDYPGVYDVALWRLARSHCHHDQPTCSSCPLSSLCAYPRVTRSENAGAEVDTDARNGSTQRWRGDQN